MTSSAPRAPVYLPYDEAEQPVRAIDGYPRSLLRTPLGPFVSRPLTRTERTGPTNLAQRLAMGPDDLSQPVPGARAIGQYIAIGGRVLDEDGSPVPGAVLELWQANAAGKYAHEADHNDAPLDRPFQGTARIATDAMGRYAIHTVKPGAYPVPHSTWEWRAPHIHVSIVGGSWMSRLVTQAFFPGEWLNQQDLLLNAVPSPNARERLLVRPLPTVVRPAGNLLAFEHDFILRGSSQTPSLTDVDHDTPQQFSHTSANLTTGPFFPPALLDGCDDLTVLDGRRASGPPIILTGRVLDEHRDPTVNTIVEIWQADAGGTFRHPEDPRHRDADPGFCGWGRASTDRDGCYRFRTVIPGVYRSDDGQLRLPHVNIRVLASGIMRPLVTTAFIGDPSAQHDDPVLNAVTGAESRRRLFASGDSDVDADGLATYRFDIVLRGTQETPFFLD
jgi:protocatechuate 3,4-dioxygenase beta subunit